MKKLGYAIELLLLLILFNSVPICSILDISVVFKVLGIIALSVFYIVALAKSEKLSVNSAKLKRLKSACTLIMLTGVSALAEIVIIVLYFMYVQASVLNRVFSIVTPVLLISLMLLVGVIRTAVYSRQLKIIDYVLMFMLWWFPIVNIVLFRRFYKVAKREIMIESSRIELENARAVQFICKTKYPILMVHGIFFRDWQIFNYWGRIPASLINNGAQVYYGNQQSACSVAESAAELRNRIMQVIEETGAEKVNIIAHSKGGLDSRYAISRLGMDKYVATLTTINTPHKGCDMVDYLLGKLPDSFVSFVEKKYNKIFGKLGDKAPDFLAGVKDLSAVRARSYDEEMPDSPLVKYQSCCSVMSRAGSAGFPLNISYLIIKKLNGANDGLVWVESAKHGDFTLIPATKKRGVSHGDVIDLMRENIDGYDVREYYVDIVRKLRESGY